MCSTTNNNIPQKKMKDDYRDTLMSLIESSYSDFFETVRCFKKYTNQISIKN